MIGNRLFSDEYEHVVRLLVEARRASGLSQRELAARLGRSPSHVSRIELRQRRVEIVEFHLIALALGLDPVQLFGRLSQRLRNAA